MENFGGKCVWHDLPNGVTGKEQVYEEYEKDTLLGLDYKRKYIKIKKKCDYVIKAIYLVDGI